MLPKSERFTKKDFKDNRPKVFFRGEVFDAAYITLPTQKFACVTAKKTLRRSVDRNCVKRRMLNTVQQCRPLFTKHSIVFYPKKNCMTVPYSQIKEEMVRAFATLH